MIQTRFTEMFDLTYPIMSAPMALHSGGTIAGAVSAAGGLGTFGGITLAGPEWITTEISRIRDVTDATFGVGFITSFLDFASPLLDTALADGAPVIVFSFGDPTRWIEQARAAGARTIAQIQTVEGADLAVEAGVEVLVAQGNEAGGHTGHSALYPLLSRVVERHPNVPVLAAGGIGDGRALAAALCAGADGALVGTAFMATPEMIEIDDVIKNQIIDSDGTNTVFTKSWDALGGLPWPDEIGERVLANSFTDRWQGREGEVGERRAELADDHAYTPDHPDPAMDHIPFGPSAGVVDAIHPAAQVTERMCVDAEHLLRTRPGSILV